MIPNAGFSNYLHQDKIVVGHAVHNDFRVLRLVYPKDSVVDTAAIKTLKELANWDTKQSVSLKRLALSLLGEFNFDITQYSVTIDLSMCMSRF